MRRTGRFPGIRDIPSRTDPERRKAVVEKKVFPQIKELIENYHPVLFWGIPSIIIRRN